MQVGTSVDTTPAGDGSEEGAQGVGQIAAHVDPSGVFQFPTFSAEIRDHVHLDPPSGTALLPSRRGHGRSQWQYVPRALVPPSDAAHGMQVLLRVEISVAAFRRVPLYVST